ncbi:MAG: ABC transporter ATP-binding protein [Candidatus Marinimicrobia bacterium]|nr:ABC transporter ATP-binding protein [Candidatus Neomarinimicrobiota bacterium]MBT5955165.1 ABC transporter ATP-binding protein [Candidatus Neomarinimicrobiota bacterium]MBT6870411.1 ABC transporter ATP-binding protein [Candidatus Neomarinimicrobiota bacterium]MBT7377274.1 ABC transporter ATP-binding protein [Candidatus Neomarinimicrobiota bacterium]
MAIHIDKLTKIYEGGFKALDAIDLDIPKGSFFGLLGPNGAGKTTTIGILTGLVNLTSGSAAAMGKDVVNEFREARSLMGLSPQELNFDVFFSIRQLLILQAGYYGLSKDRGASRADLMLERFGLTEKANNTARELSGGMKRRVQIAKALVHDPPIIILDEPTAGVDIELRHMLWDYLRELNAKGKTILLTTHYIEEAEALCDRVAIIDQGKIVTEGSPQELISTLGTGSIEIKIHDIPAELNLEPWSFSQSENTLHIPTSRPESDMPKIINLLTQLEVSIEEVKICKSSLEDVFLKLTGRSFLEDTMEIKNV